jgi:hypothetical protein
MPMEYAVEMNRLIELQMEGSIGYQPDPAAALDGGSSELGGRQASPPLVARTYASSTSLTICQ